MDSLVSLFPQAARELRADAVVQNWPYTHNFPRERLSFVSWGGFHVPYVPTLAFLLYLFLLTYIEFYNVSYGQAAIILFGIMWGIELNSEFKLAIPPL